MLRHPLDGDGEGDHRVVEDIRRSVARARVVRRRALLLGALLLPLSLPFPLFPRLAVRAPRAQRAEHRVARLAEEQLLVVVDRALGDDFAPLPRHQVEQLVDEEGGREGGDAAARDGDELAADGAAELARVAGERGDDAVQALDAHRVRAVEQLGRVLAAIVHAWKTV